MILIAAFLILCLNVPVMAGYNENDVRAVWISTVYNLDYPSAKNDEQAQKQQFISILDNLQNIGINTVVVQVRPKSDALYNSSINPWSDVLTGTQGKNPGYDPLKFMIDETHKRGMSFHAWLNPYRVTTTGTDVSVLAENHPARLHPDWLITYNNALYYNPDLMQVKEYIAQTVKEIVSNYDVDAIHFDDYFYPSGYPLPAGETRDGVVANARRQHINTMVEMVYNTIKSVDPSVKFGISPMGIWKNDYSGKYGSVINGNEAYYSVYADAVSWINNGWIDYIVPQIYWENGNSAADYSTLVKWWSDAVKGTNVKLYIGEATYKDVVSAEIKQHLEICDSNSAVGGNFFFSLKDILNNRQGCADSIKAFYSTKGSNNNSSNNSNSSSNSNNQTTPPLGKGVEAIYNSSPVMINGDIVNFEAYNIDGYNYFKLRDIAMAFTDTGSKFDTVWDEATQSINMVTDKKYTVAGGELALGDGKNKTAYTSTAKIMLNGKEVSAQAYNINGNNYFKLRDLGEILTFGVDWDEEKRVVSVFTLN